MLGTSKVRATREQSWQPVSPSCTFAYDDRNRLLSTTDPLGKVESYTYDGNDNLLTRMTPKAETISFAYDEVNQLLSKTLPGSLVTGYTYDTVGNLTGVTDPDSALTMTYDQANRLVTTATTGSSNQPNVTLTYTHDKNGNRLTLNGGTASHTYVYDVLNRLTSVTTPAGAATLAYDALSRRTAMTLPNGTNTTYNYDPASQVTQIIHQLTATSTQINKADYLYNNVGNRTSLTDRRGAQAFGYDNLDRLTSASHPLLATPQAFAYDPVGNRTTNGSVVNAGDQLTTDANYAYQYDDNGNLTRKTLLATGNYSQYTYDAENRLTKVEDFVAGNPTAFATSTYRYDGIGRRIEKVASGQTKRYVYDGEDILLEYDGANVLQARHSHGPGIDEPIAVTKAGSTFFYHQDGLGTVTDLTDFTGATTKSYSYDAYGNILESPGTVEQPYTYTGREFDSESGLYYYRARTYDSAIGRFAQKDPIGIANGDPNLYAYVRENPLYYTDPAGQCPWCIAAIVGAVSGAGFDLAYQLIVNGGALKCVDWESVGSAALTGAALSALGPTGALLGRGGAKAAQYGYGSPGLLNQGYARFGWSGPKGDMDVLSLRVGKRHFDFDQFGGLPAGADPARDGALAGLIGAGITSDGGGPCGCIR